jgi:hypothetical protein
MNSFPKTFPILTLLCASFCFLESIQAADAPQNLDSYWPIDVPQRGWRLVRHADRTQHTMTITHTKVNQNSFRLWFSDKPGQAKENYSIEEFRYCENPGAEPWLWLDKYIDYDKNSKEWNEHSVQSTKILLTPEGGEQAEQGGGGQPATRPESK